MKASFLKSIEALGAKHARQADNLAADQAAELVKAIASQVKDYDTYVSIRAAWIAGLVAERGCKEASGRARWSELYRLTGLPIPCSTSADAKRKAAARAAKKAAKSPAEIKLETGKDAGSVSDPTPPASGKGEAGKIAEIILNAREAHLIGLMHKGDWAGAQSFLAEMATLAAQGVPQVGAPVRAKVA